VRRNIELQVGTLVLVAIVAVSFGLLFLKEFKFRTATWPLEVSFSDASGVSVGAPILIRGVEKGKVQSIRLERGKVDLVLGIEEGVEITDDAIIAIQPDMLGPTYVTIEQGTSGTMLEPGAQMEGIARVELAALLENSAGLLLRVDRLTRRVDEFIACGAADSLFADISSGARELRLLAAETREVLPPALEHLDELSLELGRFSRELRPEVFGSLEHLDSLTVELRSLSADLRVAGGGLEFMGEQLESGQGTLGRLVAEDDLYLRLQSTLGEVDSLVADIKANPKRYISFELF